MAEVKTVSELLQIFITTLQGLKPELTDTNEGSNIDVIGGATATAVNEQLRLALDEFRKTFIDGANGPEITGGVDELMNLVVDHWGDDFKRPDGAKSTGTITFSRPNDDAGNVTIITGTIVKTPASATGKSERFEVTTDVTMVGTSINASVRALLRGPSGNVQANKVTQIETALTDPTVVVNNSTSFTGGANSMNDAQYREFIRLLIRKIKGGTLDAIEAAANAVPGVEQATAIQIEKPVIAYDIANDAILVGAEFFRIPFVELYIADANGAASATLLNDVVEAIKEVKAYGVYIAVRGANAVVMNWTASIILNVSGPNYVALSADPQLLIDSMKQYIGELGIGADFIRADAEAAMMAIWGPSGTNDLTNFTTATPVGDISTDPEQKLIPGTVDIL